MVQSKNKDQFNSLFFKIDISLKERALLFQIAAHMRLYAKYLAENKPAKDLAKKYLDAVMATIFQLTSGELTAESVFQNIKTNDHTAAFLPEHAKNSVNLADALVISAQQTAVDVKDVRGISRTAVIYYMQQLENYSADDTSVEQQEQMDNHLNVALKNLANYYQANKEFYNSSFVNIVSPQTENFKTFIYKLTNDEQFQQQIKQEITDNGGLLKTIEKLTKDDSLMEKIFGQNYKKAEQIGEAFEKNLETQIDSVSPEKLQEFIDKRLPSLEKIPAQRQQPENANTDQATEVQLPDSQQSSEIASIKDENNRNGGKPSPVLIAFSVMAVLALLAFGYRWYRRQQAEKDIESAHLRYANTSDSQQI